MTSIQRVYSLTYNFSKLNKETEKTNGSLILKADASKQRTLSDKGIVFVFVFDFVIFVTLINLWLKIQTGILLLEYSQINVSSALNVMKRFVAACFISYNRSSYSVNVLL